MALVLIEILEIPTGEAEIVGRRLWRSARQREGAEPAVALRAAKTALCASTGYFWWGLGEDTKEVKERGGAFNPWSRFRTARRKP